MLHVRPLECFGRSVSGKKIYHFFLVFCFGLIVNYDNDYYLCKET
jgi:hypothetical protein